MATTLPKKNRSGLKNWPWDGQKAGVVGVWSGQFLR